MSLSIPTPRNPISGDTPFGVSRETLFLFTICLLDALSSAVLFQFNMASEANPVLRPFAEAGTLPFLTAKSLTFLPALAAAEWYRQRNPQFVTPLLRWAAILYLGIYSILVLRQLGG
jgi:hypothetical protein